MRIKELDGLRGIAVLAVVYYHYLIDFPRSGSQAGWLGVDLFFVLSGFLITSILLQLRHQRHYFRPFYYRRALRIMPPYFLGLIIYFIYAHVRHQPGTWSMWCGYIFYYSSLLTPTHFPLLLRGSARVPTLVALGLSVTWSLSVEEIYYTFWAAFVRLASEKTLLVILTGATFIAPLIRYWIHTTSGFELLSFYCRMDGLAYGSILAFLIVAQRRDAQEWNLASKILDIAVWIVPSMTTAFFLTFGANPGNLPVAVIGITMADFSFTLIMYALIRHSGSSHFFIRIFRTKWLRSIGMVSYSLYLFHWPLEDLDIGVLSKFHLRPMIQIPAQITLGLLISLIVAYTLWYGLESPILRFKDRLFPSSAHP